LAYINGCFLGKWVTAWEYHDIVPYVNHGIMRSHLQVEQGK